MNDRNLHLVALLFLIMFSSGGCSLKGGSQNMGYCFDIDYDSSRERIYVAAGNKGMHIFDVSKNKLDYVRNYQSGGYYRYLDCMKDCVYVAHAEDGLLVIDVSQGEPKAVWSQKQGPGMGVHAQENRALLAQGKKGLSIFDTTNPEEPILISRCKTSGEAWGVWAGDKYAYVADVDMGVTIVDISDVRQPRIAAFVTWDKVKPMAEIIRGEGNYIYVASGIHGLVIIDVTEPTAPKVVGKFKSGKEGYGEGLAVRNQVVYLANGNDETAKENGLYIIDVSDPGHPAVIGKKHFGGWVENVALDKNFALVANTWYGVRMINISNQRNPKIQDEYGNTTVPTLVE